MTKFTIKNTSNAMKQNVKPGTTAVSLIEAPKPSIPANLSW